MIDDRAGWEARTGRGSEETRHPGFALKASHENAPPASAAHLVSARASSSSAGAETAHDAFCDLKSGGSRLAQRLLRLPWLVNPCMLPSMIGGRVVKSVLAACSVIVGCGATERDPSEPLPMADSGPQDAGEPDSPVTDASTPADSGDAGAPQDAESLLPVAGRWGMFQFEDPVGVELSYEDGVLSGRGCAAGAPPLEQESLGFCGPISGAVQGRQVRFDFLMEGFSVVYGADVMVSEDGSRMAGQFLIDQNPGFDPTAWLRVDTDAAWLTLGQPGSSSPLDGRYELTLLESTTGTDEYVSGTAYSFSVWLDRGVSGALGSFWHTELSRPSPDVVRAGPVAETLPELPVELELRLGGDTLSEVLATMASGGTYLFGAVRPDL